jgi:hypothetical protein
MNIQFKHRPGRYYEWEWYYSPQGLEMGEVYGWCRETFGHPGLALGDGSWDCHSGWIKFCKQEDMLLFVLRWS